MTQLQISIRTIVHSALFFVTLAVASSLNAQTYTIADQQCADAIGTNGVIADACQCGQSDCKTCGIVNRKVCNTCDAGCELEIKEEKIKKTCFEVEKKTICIPAVKLPFGFCCKPLFARSKTIKVLKTKSYECPTTRYVWSKAEPKVVECTETLSVHPNPMPQPTTPNKVVVEPTLIEAPMPSVPAEAAASQTVVQPVPVTETEK